MDADNYLCSVKKEEEKELTLEITKRNKSIKDYIHSLITIDNHFFKFIDTPQIQRLRDLYELPSCQYVFPSANHRRFEHSLGTFHLANRYFEIISKNQIDLNIPIEIKNSVLIAALFHNVGYGPFGEVFDNFCKEDLHIESNFKTRGASIFKAFLKEKNINPKELKKEEQFIPSIVEDIISGRTESKKYYEQIVNNNLNGIDVNIFDTLRRDPYKIGFPDKSYDYEILMNNTFVMGNQLYYRESDANSIKELFYTKYVFTKQYYMHRVCNGIDLMFRDILRKVKDYYHFKEMLSNFDEHISEFLKLNDISILQKINNPILPKHLSTSKLIDTKGLEEAKVILNRISKRDLYKEVGEYDMTDHINIYETFNSNELFEFIPEEDKSKITEEDIRIFKYERFIGIDKEDIISKVNFFHSENNSETGMKILKSVKLTSDKLSNIKSERNHELKIRIYITDRNSEKFNIITKAFVAFCDKNGLPSDLRKEKGKNGTNGNIRSPVKYSTCNVINGGRFPVLNMKLMEDKNK
ncbi:MAG: HD domain-containing protein [archaeon]|nr:HD domain-containing protein [archaeon]